MSGTPYTAQVQRAIAALMAGYNMWTGTNIFGPIGIDQAIPSDFGIAFNPGGTTPSDTASKLYSPDGTTLYFNGAAVSGGTVGTTIAVTDDTTTNATVYPLWAAGTSGEQALKVSSSKITFNPSTGVLTATAFAGALTGNVTGNVTGTAATVTGATQSAITSAANLATVGTITSGVWNAGAVTSSSTVTATTAVITGGVKASAVVKTGDYTITASDYLVVGNSSSALTMTMLAASSNTGRIFVFKNKNNGLMTIDATSLGQLTGSTATNTLTLGRGDSITVQSDGATWVVI